MPSWLLTGRASIRNRCAKSMKGYPTPGGNFLKIKNKTRKWLNDREQVRAGDQHERMLSKSEKGRSSEVSKHQENEEIKPEIFSLFSVQLSLHCSAPYSVLLPHHFLPSNAMSVAQLPSCLAGRVQRVGRAGTSIPPCMMLLTTS